MKGTLLNTATVVAGSAVGLAAGKWIPPTYERVAIDGLGLVVCVIGVKMFFQSKNVLIVVAAIAAGGILGTLLGIAPGLEHLADWVRASTGGRGTFDEALVTTSVLYCVGPMTLLGCLEDGIEGKIDLLATKSTLDGIGSIFFAATLGVGVLFSAAVVLVVQGAITLAAKRLQRFAKDEVLFSEAIAVGGAIIFGMGLGLLDIKKLKMETYLPAIVLAPMFAALARRLKPL